MPTPAMNRVAQALAISAALAAGAFSHASTVSLATTGAAYTQNFDTLASTGTSTAVPAGWSFVEGGSNANGAYTAGTGSGNAGDTYSFGSAGSSERALGGLRSGSLVPLFGASFSNDTGATIASLLVAFTGEQWRVGAVGRSDRLDFQYSLDATSLSTGTWTDFDALDFFSPTTGPTAGALNGNAAANRQALSATIGGLSIASGSTFWLRFSDFDATGSDDGLAIDDFSLTAQAAAVPEPGSLALVALGGLAALATRRRRRSA